MQDAVADVLASRARLEPPLSRFIVGSIAAHLLLGAVMIVSTSLTPAPETKKVINVRLSSGAAGSPAPAAPGAQTRPRPAAARPTPPPPEATPVPMTRPVPPPPAKAPEQQPRKAAAAETLYGRSELPVTANPTPTTTAAPAPTKAPATPAPATGPAEAGTAVGTMPGIGKAGVMELEGGPFPFSDYLERMIGLIGRRWQRPQTGVDPTATVYFIIERNGRVRDVAISEPSGVGAFDRAAMRAVLESSPLPPLPPGYSGQWLGVHLAFH